jgi:hypothetical protein
MKQANVRDGRTGNVAIAARLRGTGDTIDARVIAAKLRGEGDSIDARALAAKLRRDGTR